MRIKKPMSFDDLLLDLQDQKTKKAPNHISMDELFDESFMHKHTNFNSFEAFMEKGNIDARTLEEINNYPEELLDRHVVRETDFANWEAMKNKAESENSDS